MNDYNNEIVIVDEKNNQPGNVTQLDIPQNSKDTSDKKLVIKNEKEIVNSDFKNNNSINNNNEELKTIIAQTENTKNETIPQSKEEISQSINAKNSNSNETINSITDEKETFTKNKTVDYEITLNNDTIDQNNDINKNDISDKNINNINENENEEQNEEQSEDTNKVPKNMTNLSDTKIIENFLLKHSVLPSKCPNTQKRSKKVYFTEANISSTPRIIYNKNTIPTISSNKIKLRQQNRNSAKRTKNKSTSLDNLSPDVYMGKKYKSKHSKKNFDFMSFKIKCVEEEIKKQNQYDFERAMKDIQIKTDNKTKIKERVKRMEEDHQKLIEKLKNMEEFRQKQLKEKINKVNKKQKIKPNKNNKSQDISKKLPPINYNIGEKADLIRQRQKEYEEDFCLSTEQKLKENEYFHKKNYLKQCRILSKKIKNKKKIYNERVDKCILATKDNDSEREENYLEKDIMKSYNVNQNVLRSLSQKNVYLDVSKKNYENVQENKEILEKKRQKLIKAYLKKANKQNSTSLSKIDNSAYIHTKENMEKFSSLQKKNISKAQKEFDLKHKELVSRQEDLKWYINKKEKDDSRQKQVVMEKKFKNYNKNSGKIKSLDKYKDRMDRENIMNQNEKEKMKKFHEVKRIEYLEKKKKEEEEEMKKSG